MVKYVETKKNSGYHEWREGNRVLPCGLVGPLLMAPGFYFGMGPNNVNT